MSSSADEIIDILGLQPHPEGGYFHEPFRDSHQVDGNRAAITFAYFLLKKGQRSHWHRIDTTEIWHWYAGAPLKLEIAENESRQIFSLGQNLKAGERPHAVVPANAWQSAEPLGDFTLVGVTVAPGFEFANFELAPTNWEPRMNKAYQ